MKPSVRAWTLRHWPNVLGYALILVLSLYIGVVDHSFLGGFAVMLVCLAWGFALTWTMVAILVVVAFRLDRTAFSATRRDRAKLLASRLWLTAICLVVGAWAVGSLMRSVATGEDYHYPRFLLTKDYGNHWPKGEIDRIRQTECTGSNIPFLVTKSDGQYLTCGTWPWSVRVFRVDVGQDTLN
jgi:hypothetical protein